MPGDGTKLDITTNRPPAARLLDLTRLVSRAGRLPTGVDRVELAYLRQLVAQSEAVAAYGVVRTHLGYILLDAAGLSGVEARVTGRVPWGPADWRAPLARGKSQMVRRAEADLRRLALGRAMPMRLAGLLARHVPPGAAYLNVGHSNLTERMLGTVKSALGARISVLLHDTIPLDYPQYQRPGTPERFGAMMRRVQTWADLVICNSAHTQTGFLHHAAPDLRCPDTVVAHLGLDLVPPDPDALAEALCDAEVAVGDLEGPYFVTVGTIEPRKRHDLLLDLWQTLPEPAPLFICGSRGWQNDAVFQRLDALSYDAPVHELPGLSDGAIAALVQGATASLFPSDAEGFGLPVVEAVALNTPVMCQNLPVYKEFLGDIPVYVDGTDGYQWRQRIERLIQFSNPDARMASQQVFVSPTWADHFNIVLKLT